ncbi:MAG TPA: hypothetical protein VHC69_33310 [Polyangiaceae bacterium]|nr:hypothetical protein [Polyangiaceae bacterium]
MQSFRLHRAAARFFMFVSGACMVACLDRPLCTTCVPVTTNIFVDTLTEKSVDKIDLLLMIDNSLSMADKQKVLQSAVPDLVQRLISPDCVDATGVPNKAATPGDPLAQCPSPLVREFTPIRDIHVGIVTSSLGGHGSTNLCVGNDNGTVADQELDDHGWLIGKRSRFSVPAGGAPVDAEGFLDWNPSIAPNTTVSQFTTTFEAMTTAVGEDGCGLESQLEGWYRFLVDPHPYASIQIQNCPGTTNEPCAVPVGEDTNLEAQRAAFLRPDSLVAIIMLSDENDCSIRESGQYYYAARTDIILPHGSAICATNPNDPCCYFCGSSPPAGCAADPSCATPTVPSKDPLNLRCYRDMQRFGFDFLYPTARYVNALSQAQICTSRADLAADPSNCPDLNGDKQPDIVDNPLYKTTTAVPRDSSLVFFAAIVGVPWQDIQTTVKPDGTPYPDPNELHYQTAAQMVANDTWSVILGSNNPASGVEPSDHTPPIPPTDNLMVESIDPRGGNDDENPPQPLVGTNGGYLANKVNGHEWVNSNLDDLQYACIFKLPESRDCKQLLQDPLVGCDCIPGRETDNNPLCQSPDGTYSDVQSFAKGYPGLRELQVLKDFGDNGVVASICARNLTDENAQDYGYGPAVDAIVDRLKQALTGKCLPRTLTPDASGNIPCSVIEARPTPATGAPACSATPGRSDPNPQVIDAAITRLQQSGVCGVANTPPCSAFYLCQIDEDRTSDCHKNVTPTQTGWCYVDPLQQPGDDPSLVANCPPTQRQIVRFVDPLNQTPANDASVLIACFGANLSNATTASPSDAGSHSALP